jgi:hypothetical protein
VPTNYKGCLDNSKKNISTISFLISSTASRRYVRQLWLITLGGSSPALAQTIGNAWGLDINSPRSAKIHPQDLQFCRHQQRDDPNSPRGLDNNFASERDCDSTTTTILRHHRLRRANHAAPDKI